MLPEALIAAARALGIDGCGVLVAVSGGVDSTLLVHELSRAHELGLTLAVGHVNHGLRGADSDADQAAVEATAQALGLAFRAACVRPDALREGRPSRERPTLQEAARRLRDDALRKMAAELGAAHVATAHHLDDQAETVLMRLLRGTGPDGLRGIRAASDDGVVVRPLLGVSRGEIQARATALGLSWREDPSNQDPRYARGRLRSGGLSELASRLNPNWLRAVADLAEAQEVDARWMESQVDAAADRLLQARDDGLWIAREGWNELPEALARRVARHAWRSVGGSRDVSRRHLRRILDFLRNARPGTGIELPGGFELECRAEGFSLQSRGVRPPLEC